MILLLTIIILFTAINTHQHVLQTAVAIYTPICKTKTVKHNLCSVFITYRMIKQ